MKNKIGPPFLTVFTLTLAACGGSSGSGDPSPQATEAPSANVGGTLGSGEIIACREGQTVRFNEVVSSNSEFRDSDSDTPDWLELYNCLDRDVSLTEWTITDDIENPDKWRFPQFIFGANRYLQIWASDKDRTETEELHTNFKISSEGETLYLYDDLGVLVDSILVENVPPDHSIGFTDNAELALFTSPSPSDSNGLSFESGLVTNAVEFSHQGGNTQALQLVLDGALENQTIYYTLDTSEPDESSQVYSNPIPITQNTVVRARIYEEGMLPSRIQTHSYLLGAEHDLPIISLVTERDNFFSESRGIYSHSSISENGQFPYFQANFWWDAEVPIHVSYYEIDNTLGLNFDAGVKIFGGWSRGYDQRSLSIFARGQYGFSNIEYPLFPNLEYDKFQTFILRNSGQDWSRTMLRDRYMTTLMNGSGLDTQAHRAAVAYINGEYWGVYNIREKINEHFIASKHNIDKDSIDIAENNGETIYGNPRNFRSLTNFITENSLSEDNAYENVASQIDIDNFIQYQIAQIYFNNTDWPGNNIKFWRSSELDNKWRWILFDTDFGYNLGVGIGSGMGSGGGTNEWEHNSLAFAMEANGPGWPNPPWSTLLLRRLLENNNFRISFVNQFLDAINSRFLPENSLALLNEMINEIASEIPAHRNRWEEGYDFDFNWPAENSWEDEIDRMRDFANFRPEIMLDILNSELQLGQIISITIDNTNPSAGHVQINSLDIRDESWTGRYFTGMNIEVSAIPNEGYIFSHWLNPNNSEDPELSLYLSSSATLTPVFIEQ